MLRPWVMAFGQDDDVEGVRFNAVAQERKET